MAKSKEVVSVLMDDKEYRLPEDIRDEVIYNIADLLLSVRPHKCKFTACYFCAHYGCGVATCKQYGCQVGVAKYLLSKYKERYKKEKK